MTISAEKYVATTTYRNPGVAVTTPTWIVPVSTLGDQAQAA